MNASNRYDSLFQYYAERAGLGWKFLKAQAQTESSVSLDPNAESSVGALGVMQFMRATWQEWADGTPGVQELPPHGDFDRRNPEASIRSGAALMQWILQRPITGGSLDRALVAYNWGIGNLTRCIAQWDAAWISHLPDETANYVARVRVRWNALLSEVQGETV